MAKERTALFTRDWGRYQFGFLIHALLRLFAISILAIFITNVSPKDSCNDVTGSLHFIKFTGKDDCKDLSKINPKNWPASSDPKKCLGEDLDIYITPTYLFITGDTNTCDNIDEDTQIYNYGVDGYSIGTDIDGKTGLHCDLPHQLLHGANIGALTIISLGTLLMLARHLTQASADLVAGDEDQKDSMTFWGTGSTIPILFKIIGFLGYIALFTFAMFKFASNPKCNPDAEDNFGNAETGFLYWAGWYVVAFMGFDMFAEIFSAINPDFYDTWKRVSSKIGSKIANPTSVISTNGDTENKAVSTTTKSLYF